MAVEILTIGNELLLGVTADTNTHTIANVLKENGLDLVRVTIVGDDHVRIAQAMREAASRAKAVLVTGGLGPTVDDPTRAAAAEAAGVELVFHPDLWRTILERFQNLGRTATENNRVQAQLPAGAIALPNPVGTAPGFALPIGGCLVIAMPGVPSEMRQMLMTHAIPLLRERLGPASIIRTRTLHVAGIGESVVDQAVGKWEQSENPTAGLAAHAALVDIRIVARAADEASAERLIAPAEKEIRAQLAHHVFGADSETLAGAVLRSLPAGSTLASVEAATQGALAARLTAEPAKNYAGGLVWTDPMGTAEDLLEATDRWREEADAEFGVGVQIRTESNRRTIDWAVVAPTKRHAETRPHHGPPADSPEWAANTALFSLLQITRS